LRSSGRLIPSSTSEWAARLRATQPWVSRRCDFHPPAGSGSTEEPGARRPGLPRRRPCCLGTRCCSMDGHARTPLAWRCAPCQISAEHCAWPPASQGSLRQRSAKRGLKADLDGPPARATMLPTSWQALPDAAILKSVTGRPTLGRGLRWALHRTADRLQEWRLHTRERRTCSSENNSLGSWQVRDDPWSCPEFVSGPLARRSTTTSRMPRRSSLARAVQYQRIRAFGADLRWIRLAANRSKKAVAELMQSAWRTIGQICERVIADAEQAAGDRSSRRLERVRGRRSHTA
jgi:hypothetical protein